MKSISSHKIRKTIWQLPPEHRTPIKELCDRVEYLERMMSDLKEFLVSTEPEEVTPYTILEYLEEEPNVEMDTYFDSLSKEEKAKLWETLKTFKPKHPINYYLEQVKKEKKEKDESD